MPCAWLWDDRRVTELTPEQRERVLDALAEERERGEPVESFFPVDPDFQERRADGFEQAKKLRGQLAAADGDELLIRTGETVDVLLDVTNPGLWMAHCHFAEHRESGLMFSFEVVT